jgi:hypothetical protein
MSCLWSRYVASDGRVEMENVWFLVSVAGGRGVRVCCLLSASN